MPRKYYYLYKPGFKVGINDDVIPNMIAHCNEE